MSTDSGVGHIAAAMGVPTLSLIGPGDHRRIRPYGKNCDVITHRAPCSPCILYPFHTDYSHTNCTTLDCLRNISPDEVRDKLLSML